jgi:biopolymer transport protein ExbB
MLSREEDIANRVLDTASDNWGCRSTGKNGDQAANRTVSMPLRLSRPDPEVFRLALEAAAEDELATMRRGEKVLRR